MVDDQIGGASTPTTHEAVGGVLKHIEGVERTLAEETGMVPLDDSDVAAVGGYSVVSRLGSGGMGMVYLARSVSGRQVAVKLVHAQYAESEEFRVRFRHEIAAARRVSGAFTAPVVDADPEAERPWMATLYVPGPTLAQRVAEGGPVVGAGLRVLALGLSEALRDIHRAGVVHRDLKPANVLMAADGPRVIDFGISRATDRQALTATGRVFGTPPFMSPEQLTSRHGVGPASDVFSLASVLVFAACGYGPFDGGTFFETAYNVVHDPPVLNGVPESLRSIVVRCLEKDPDRRPGLGELLPLFEALPTEGSAYTPAVSGPVATARVVVGDSAQSRPSPRRRVLLASMAAGLVLAGVGMVVAHWPGWMTGGSGDVSGAGPTVSPSSAPSMPEGWRPWLTTLQTKTKTPLYGVSDADSGCLVSGDALYCGGEGFTAARLNVASGKAVWRFSAGMEFSTPVMVGDGTVVVNDLKGPAWSTDKRRWVTGLSTGNGRARWTHSVAEGSQAVAFGKWAVALSVDQKHLIAMNADDGTEAWRFQVPAGDYCKPWTGNGVMYAFCSPGDAQSYQGALWRFDPSDGEAREVGAVPVHARPVGVDGDELVLLEYPVDTKGTPGAYTSVLRVRTATGKARRVALPKRGRVTRNDGVRLIGESLYLVRADGLVTAVSARTGTVRWRHDTGVQDLSAPVLSEKYRAVYFVNDYGRLLALGTAAGNRMWQTTVREGARVQAGAGPPRIYLKSDAIVVHAGGLTFSVSPLKPNAPASD